VNPVEDLKSCLAEQTKWESKDCVFFTLVSPAPLLTVYRIDAQQLFVERINEEKWTKSKIFGL
jgi:hypothetical protein